MRNSRHAGGKEPEPLVEELEPEAEERLLATRDRFLAAAESRAICRCDRPLIATDEDGDPYCSSCGKATR
jgi:hypothetical protein